MWMLRASLTLLGRAATCESQPDFSVGGGRVTARDGPGATVPSLGRSRGPARLGVSGARAASLPSRPDLWCVGRAASPLIFLFFLFYILFAYLYTCSAPF